MTKLSFMGTSTNLVLKLWQLLNVHVARLFYGHIFLEHDWYYVSNKLLSKKQTTMWVAEH